LSLLLDKGHGIRRDSNRAARLLSEAAWAGYLPSQLLLGEREYPSSDAMHWYKTAAEQGDKKAQFRYADSFVVACQAPRRETYPVVAKYMLASAEQGYAPAQLKLYYMYRLGWGVQKDDAAAERWLDKAAYQGYPEALAKKYNSIKLDSDKRVEAYAWFLVADERGVGKTDDGRRMRRELSSAQRKEAKQRAAELSRKIPEWND
jgi:TPR repeat protein